MCYVVCRLLPVVCYFWLLVVYCVVDVCRLTCVVCCLSVVCWFLCRAQGFVLVAPRFG